MRLQIAVACCTLFIAQNAVGGFSPKAGEFVSTGGFLSKVENNFLAQAAGKQGKTSDFSFAGVQYFHRFTNGDQHEYTPSGQEDLKAWTDMVTLLRYPKAKDGDALAATANAVLENYKANKAMVVKTDSVPRTQDRPAEHLIVVIFGRPAFIEVAFSRFRMHNGVGTAVVYSHRIYGNRVGDQMSAWLDKNGQATERELMKWDAMPR